MKYFMIVEEAQGEPRVYKGKALEQSVIPTLLTICAGNTIGNVAEMVLVVFQRQTSTVTTKIVTSRLTDYLTAWTVLWPLEYHQFTIWLIRELFLMKR